MQPTPTLTSAPFGIMIPGQLAVTRFQPLGTYYTMDLPAPNTVHSIAFYLLSPIQEGFAACLYYSRFPFEGTTFIGAIANQRPSDIFATSFHQILNGDEQVKLAIQIEPINEEVMELVKLTNDSKNMLEYSLTIAQNLYNFMTAYNKEMMVNGQQMDVLITPVNVLQLWIAKFQQKYKENPNFIYKTTH